MKDIFIDFNVELGWKKVWKWKFWILGATFIGGIVAIALSFRLPNEFKSTASFIPPNILLQIHDTKEMKISHDQNNFLLHISIEYQLMEYHIHFL